MWEWRVLLVTGSLIEFESESAPVSPYEEGPLPASPVDAGLEMIGPIVATNGTRYAFPRAAVTMLAVVPKARRV